MSTASEWKFTCVYWGLRSPVIQSVSHIRVILPDILIPVSIHNKQVVSASAVFVLSALMMPHAIPKLVSDPELFFYYQESDYIQYYDYRRSAIFCKAV
jgi:hypothetical protein